MHPIIAEKLPDLLLLCKHHKIQSLYLFGSFASGNINSNSDVDILVTFGNVDLSTYFNNYMELKDSLEKILGRKVDLLEEKTIKNPILQRSINKNKQLIYGRAS